MARQQMELIPPPSKTRYMAVKSLSVWENPYVTVQGEMVTLHVMLADANTSDMGLGGMLRPAGARRQNLNVRVSELPAALNAIPEGSWPYGRVIAVEEAHEVPVSARPQVRRNMETVMKQLSDLGVSSLKMVNLMLAVELEFDIAIPQSDITPENFHSVAAIQTLVVRTLSMRKSG